MTDRIGVVVSSQYDGGAERYLYDLYRDLDGRARPVLLGSLPHWSSRTGLDRVDIGLRRKWGRSRAVGTALRAPLERVRAVRNVTRQHRDDPVALFHAQFKREQLLLTPSLSTLAPVVWTEHGGPVGGGRPALRGWYARAARSVAAIVAVAPHVADDLRSLCGPGVRIEVIPNAVDLTRFAPADAHRRSSCRQALGLPDDRVIVAAVARLHPAKRLERAIDAAAASGAVLVVAGEGADRARLERGASADVRFLGARNDPEKVYAAADAFMFCGSPLEGFPLSILEAAASGCATFGFVEDDMEPVTASGGRLLDRPADLARHLTRGELSERGAAARTWAEGFDVGSWRRRHLELFRDIAAGI